MDRLTIKAPSGLIHLGDDKPDTLASGIKKLSDYEDLEEQCLKEYGFDLYMIAQKYNEFLEHMHELAEYWELEKKGKLRRLPCKVGDKAYYVHREYSDKTKRWFNKIDEVEVDSFVLNVNLFVNVSMYIGGDRFRKTLTPYKTLFFTREQAESALEKMKGEKYETD